MITIDVLKEYGADTAEGLARCMNKEDFYLKMVNMGLKDERFTTLKGALESNNLKDAFEMSHALKGVLGNLALTPMFEPISELTELLRNEQPGDYIGLYNKMIQEKERLDQMAG